MRERPSAQLTVRPGGPLTGRFTPPGDKSITHRAYLLGGLAEGETRVEQPNPGLDCEATLSCLAALGVPVTRHEHGVTLRGLDMRLREPDRVLECGNSGTTLRLLAGPLAAQPFLSVLAGDASLHRRPVDRIVEPLRRMGARLSARDQDRYPPLVVQGGELKPIHYALPVASAQVASALLLAGLYAAGVTRLELPVPARDHTQRMLPAFGAPVRVAEGADRGVTLEVEGPVRLRATAMRVPGDFSAAAFFLAAAAATPGASVTAVGVGLNPTRTGLLDVLEAMGAKVTRRPQPTDSGEPYGEVTVTGPERLRAFDVPREWLPRLIDEVPAWAVAAASAEGVSTLRGAEELRVKESDRLAAMAGNLSALGTAARETPDGLIIAGGRPRGGVVAAHADHRVAMACAVLGTFSEGPVTIEDRATIATSYPLFAGTLAALGGHVDDPAPASTRT
ncbi:MAG TPA: 3-phosphoshikimate 1-carboxyvinyltransferase [Candidatus Limnocylindria bacterium]|nr:3-phosphoshikimate 1-carboxyvinyltransferase [Candidatus Limnocylindria bacterium]